MQKHKSWLVITIWISVIAFVGAGFVGWGSYDFSKKGGVIAKVGSEEIEYPELQREYSNLYAQYSSVFGKNFDEKMAKSLGLDKQALANLIKWSLVTNFAKDNGIMVVKSEIAQKIGTMKEFQKDGKFDKETYNKVLKNVRLKPNEFEESIKKEILITKTLSILMPNISDIEKKSLTNMLFIEDRLKIALIDSKDVDIKLNENEIKKFWEQNKEKYKTSPKVKLALFDVPVSNYTFKDEELKKHYDDNRNNFKNSDGKIMKFEDVKDEVSKDLNFKKTKKLANKNFYDFKKDKIKPTKEIVKTYSELNFEPTIVVSIEKSIKGDTLKPIKTENGFTIVKVIEKIDAKTKSFEQASSQAKMELLKKLKSDKMVKMAENKLKKFDGKDIGFISRGSIKSIKGLDEQEASTLVNNIFEKNLKSGYVVLDDKVVVYDITKQRFAESKDEANFDDGIKNTKRELIEESFIKSLEKRYEVVSYYKKEE
jgi:peptidyl-prolyl cis-trans isomerase D